MLRIPVVFAMLVIISAISGALPRDTCAQAKIPIEGSDRWLVQYADSTVSINDFCPVAKRRLGTGKAPIYVNHRPVGFC